MAGGKRRFARWLRTQFARRQTVFLTGVLLLLVPTVYSVFPELTEADVVVRALAFTAWCLVALLVVWSGSRQSTQMDDLMGKPLKRRASHRQLATREIIERLLTKHPFPGHYQCRLFLYDETLDRLIPTYDPAGAAGSAGWAPGTGVTGRAYSSEQFVMARGDECHDGTYGLTVEEQAKYVGTSFVASQPILTARGECIGILTVSSSRDDGHVASPGGRDQLNELSVIVGRVLIDISTLVRE